MHASLSPATRAALLRYSQARGGACSAALTSQPRGAYKGAFVPACHTLSLAAAGGREATTSRDCLACRGGHSHFQSSNIFKCLAHQFFFVCDKP